MIRSTSGLYCLRKTLPWKQIEFVTGLQKRHLSRSLSALTINSDDNYIFIIMTIELPHIQHLPNSGADDFKALASVG